MSPRDRSITHWLLVAVLALAPAPAAQAYSAGISSTTFGATGCPACHVGGTTPSVLLSGPSSVQPGSTADYTLTVFGNPVQDFGGFNATASLGTLSVGGPFASGTTTITGLGGATEITHSAPKAGDFMSFVEFSFRWTAPANFTAVTLRGWGNAVNLNGNSIGDAAALATIEVSAMATSTPVPTSTPTPTAIVCGTTAALAPPLPADSARDCQVAIAKAGSKYLRKDLTAVGDCLAALHSGVLTGDSAALCVGGPSTLPTHAKTADRIGRAQSKALALLESACPDTALDDLDACAATQDALGDCFLAQHRQAVIDAVASQYGTLVPSDDRGQRKCQKTINSAASRFLTTTLKAAQKCLNKRFVTGVPDGGALCVGAVMGGVFIPPTDEKAAAEMAAAEAKLIDKVGDKCDDAQIAALDACGDTNANATACLLCTHRDAVFDLLASAFGGAE